MDALTRPSRYAVEYSRQPPLSGTSLHRRKYNAPPFAPSVLTTYLFTTATSTPFNKSTNIRMALDAAKKAALRRIFPQHDIKLSCVIKDIFVVGLRRERGI